jgi:putative ABC transport system permease protein
MLPDLRSSSRALAASPQFTVVVLIVLALGIGANAAIVSVVNAVLLRPLPFHDPDRLVLLSMQRDREPGVMLPMSFPDYFDVRDQRGSFEAIGAWAFGRGNVSAAEPEQVLYAVATSNIFSILGVALAIGPGQRGSQADRFLGTQQIPFPNP